MRGVHADVGGGHRDDEAEDHRLEGAGQVVGELHDRERGLEVGPERHAGDGGLGHPSADDAGEVHHRRQDGHRHHAGHHAGDHQELERVHGDGFQGVDLLGHLHRPQLGPDPRAHPARDEEADHEGAGLAHEGQGEGGGNQRLGPEALERGAGVHGEDDAHREAGGGDEGHREPADLVELARRLPQLERRPEGLAHRPGREEHGVAGPRQRRHHVAVEEIGHQKTHQARPRLTMAVSAFTRRVATDPPLSTASSGRVTR